MKKFKELPFIIQLLVSLVVGFGLWYIVRNFIFFEKGLTWIGIVDLITSNLQFIVNHTLSLIGIENSVDGLTINIKGYRGMQIIYGCLSISHFALFTGLVTAFPGQWKHKLWYLPTGVLLLHLLNAFRLVLIGLILRYAPGYEDFAHYYLTRIIMYSGILVLWIYWVMVISKK